MTGTNLFKSDDLRITIYFIESLENADKIHTMQYEFKNKKITVMGLGLFGGGVGVA